MSLHDIPAVPNLPFMIQKLVGMNPAQVASIHEALKHPQYGYDSRRAFFKHNARPEFQHEPEMCRTYPPEILSSAWNKEYNSYTIEIKVPILLNNGARLFEDPEHRRLLPLSVVASILSAAGIFPDAEEEQPIGMFETHGTMEIIAPLTLPVAMWELDR